ncbi:putative glycerol-3-phosphate dehydrogenase [Gregarina niphandrodes]|uniref:Glycerol-3-phosphate dehydrogenase [NAD(+)] n=1 Tax=Gregarina niphandrodes TaxID=110365 RepID=A0A023BCF2_GRENI|nr:putative glycerol-3-phosphate dehydrogenase [Gregarina niphandrodes]EZG83906.1 putative glycerol-3-phosphate dehydrogenase [Gregarina niphandrodes]|eukprot:XP_011128905.1 putative glycerol-3-phosphate dehydrogenase [Gregarina niphandrodes]
MTEKQDSMFSLLREGPLKVCILGSGNWGTACAGLVCANAKESYLFCDQVKIWVREERLDDGRLLDEVMNEKRENVKYLPGFPLADNLVAVRDITEAVRDADLIAFILPHQFMEVTCKSIQAAVKPSARAITLVKGLHICDGVPYSFSKLVETWLGIECSALSGANVAKDVANKQFCESTVGYKETEMASIWQQLFDRPHFRVHAVPDVEGVQVCGAVKNLIALAAGFCDGLGMGSNTKAAIIRLGVSEMKLFANIFFDGVLEETFFDSCGFADVITTCYGGRNVKCAAEFIRREQKSSWEDIETDLLGGQKMQGQLTCKEVHEVLVKFKILQFFPLFEVTHRVAFEHAPPDELLTVFMTAKPSEPKIDKECTHSVLYGPLTRVQRDIKKHVQLCIQPCPPAKKT